MIAPVFIIAFLVYAIWYTFQEGEIFGGAIPALNIRALKIPETMQSPLYDCNVCMTPWYGSALYWLIYGNHWIEWLIVVIAAMGVNGIINRLAPDKE
jgi:hypothetical protein